MTAADDTELERAHAEQLMAAFAVVLTHPAGFGIELFTNLWINRLEDGRFSVAEDAQVGGTKTEEIFDDVRSAIAYYLDLRDAMKLGFDFEGASRA